MKSISELLKIEKPKQKSERAELISEFVRELNLERGKGYWKGDKFIPLTGLTGKAVAIKTAHLKMDDLRYLWSICKSSNSFAKVFFGSLKEKK